MHHLSQHFLLYIVYIKVFFVHATNQIIKYINNFGGTIIHIFSSQCFYILYPKVYIGLLYLFILILYIDYFNYNFYLHCGSERNAISILFMFILQNRQSSLM